MSNYFVSNKDETARMFRSGFFEFFSRVHWSIPLIIYIPVVIYFLYKSIIILENTLLQAAGLFVLGILTWTFIEYLLHRIVFHFEPSSEWGKRLFWTFHGVHHDYPKDSKRLVMVPVVSLPLAVIFYIIFYYVFGSENFSAAFAGIVSGYLLYDITHFTFHHCAFRNKYWLALKQNHMEHHYKSPNKGFGVTSPLWDYIFGTKRKFPNPADDFVYINSVEAVSHVNIFDMNGRNLISYSNSQNLQKIMIDISSLSDGVYIVESQYGSNIKIDRLVKGK